MPDGNLIDRTHNQGPPFDPEQVDTLKAESQSFVAAAGDWLDKKQIDTEDDAARLNDFIAGVKKRRKAVDTARADAKRPHDEAGRAVQAAYKPILDQLDLAAKKVQPLLTDFLERQERERREAARRQEEEARKAREEAERQAAQAESRNDVAGESAAQEAQDRATAQTKEAEKASRQRSNVKSATGGGRTASLRTYYRAEVTNVRAAFMHYADRPEIAECLKALAEAEARGKGFNPETDKIPGCNINVERRAV